MNEKGDHIVGIITEDKKYLCMEHSEKQSNIQYLFKNTPANSLVNCSICERIINLEYTFDSVKDVVEGLLTKHAEELSENVECGWLDIYDLLKTKFGTRSVLSIDLIMDKLNVNKPTLRLFLLDSVETFIKMLRLRRGTYQPRARDRFGYIEKIEYNANLNEMDMYINVVPDNILGWLYQSLKLDLLELEKNGLELYNPHLRIFYFESSDGKYYHYTLGALFK